MSDDKGAPKVYASVLKVTEILKRDGLDKERQNVIQGYSFRGIDDVYNVLASALCEAKLIIIPRYSGVVVAARGKTKAGAELFACTLTGEFTLVSAEDGSAITTAFPGEATDTADKATNKAMSAAYKYMCIQTFCIPTKGDNDADASHNEVAAVPVATKEELAPYLKGINEAKDMKDLDQAVQELEKQSESVKAGCRDAYRAKLLELKK